MDTPHTVRTAEGGGYEIVDVQGTVVDQERATKRAVEVAYELDEGLKPVSAQPTPAGA